MLKFATLLKKKIIDEYRLYLRLDTKYTIDEQIYDTICLLA